MLEFLVIIVMVAFLFSVLAPSWLRFVDAQRLISAQSVVYQGIRQAQAKASQTHSEWHFSVREKDGLVEWSIHPQIAPDLVSNWSRVGNRVVKIDDETTLQPFGDSRTVRFDHKGNVVSRLGRVTLSSRRFESVKRCVYVSTIIGAMRQSKEQRTSRGGDFCY